MREVEAVVVRAAVGIGINEVGKRMWRHVAKPVRRWRAGMKKGRNVAGAAHARLSFMPRKTANQQNEPP